MTIVYMIKELCFRMMYINNLSGRFPQAQSVLVQRRPPSATLRKDSVADREGCSWLGDPGGEERGYGRIFSLHQQCSRFCILLCTTASSEYVPEYIFLCVEVKSWSCDALRFTDIVTTLFYNRSRGDDASGYS